MDFVWKRPQLVGEMKFRRKGDDGLKKQSTHTADGPACDPIRQLLYQLAAFKCLAFRNLGEFIGSIYTRVRAFYDAIASYLEGNLSGVKAPVSSLSERPVKEERRLSCSGGKGCSVRRDVSSLERGGTEEGVRQSVSRRLSSQSVFAPSSLRGNGSSRIERLRISGNRLTRTFHHSC